MAGGGVFYGKFFREGIDGYGEYHVPAERKVFKGIFKSSLLKATGFWYKYGDNGKNDVIMQCAPGMDEHL